MSSIREVNRMRGLVIVLMAVIMALTPVYSAFAEIQATPVVEPTPVVEDIPTEKVFEEAPIVGVATPRVEGTNEQESSIVSPLTVTPTGYFTCSQSPEDDTVKQGETITIGCRYSLINLLSIGIDAEMRLSVVGLGSGFEADISIDGESFTGSVGPKRVTQEGHYLPLNLGLLSVNLLSRFQLTVTIKVYVPSDAEVGPDQTLGAFQLCAYAFPVSCGAKSTVTLSQIDILLSDMNADQLYNLNCTEAMPTNVGIDESAVSVCTVTAAPDIGSYTLEIDRVSLQMQNVSDWDVEVSVPPDDVWIPEVSGSYPVDPVRSLGPHGSYAFQIRLTPVTCSNPESPPGVVVGVRLRLVDGDQRVSDAATVTAGTVTATFDPRTEGAASIIMPSDQERVQVPYSIQAPQVGEEEFQIKYEVAGCTPWLGLANMGPFTDEDDNQVTISNEVEFFPPSQEGYGTTVLEIPDLDTSTIGIEDTELISGTAPGQEVTVTQTIRLVYTVPPDTPVGEYTSTITVTIRSDEP